MKTLKKSLCTTAFLLFTGVAAHASTYNIGPNQPLTKINDIDWKTLQPGDTVNIYPTPGGYHETVLLSASGAAGNPITVHGVPDAQGNLPVIDGQNAVQPLGAPYYDNNSGNPVLYACGLLMVSPSLGMPYGTIPHDMVIENLELRNANQHSSFTNYKGQVQPFNGFACGLYIERGKNITLRSCQIHNCGNGVFANSKFGAAALSSNITIENNHIHDNGEPGTFGTHNIYTEVSGVTIQNNKIGPLAPGAGGENIKDRSSGTVIRYNNFIMGSAGHCIWLLEPQGGLGIIDQDPTYKKSYIYGNQIYNGPGGGGMAMIRYDGGGDNYANYRRGTLYFYNNTVINHADLSTRYKCILFWLPMLVESGGAPLDEVIDCRNNVLINEPATPGAAPSNYYLLATDAKGTLNLGTNWISPGYQLGSLPWGATQFIADINGLSNLIVGDQNGKNNPNFVSAATQDFRLANGANSIDAAGPQAGAVQGSYDVNNEYVELAKGQPRPILGAAMDLGAYESTGTPPLPALSVSDVALSEGNGGTKNAVFTVTVSPTSPTPISVDFSTANITATVPTDYIATSGTLTIPAGAKTGIISVPIVGDTLQENSETFALNLTNAVGASIADNQGIATITDDDAPVIPGTSLYALTTGNKLLTLKSSAPGTILSSVNITGLQSGEILRGIDIRPATNQLYGVGSTSRVYLIDPQTGAAQGLAPFTPGLLDFSLDIDFDPMTDQIRLVNTSMQNLRLDPQTGAVVGNDATVAFAAGDAHAGAYPMLVGAGYSGKASGSTLYAIDSALDILVRQGSVGNAPLSANSGQLFTIGALGVDTLGNTGLDVAGDQAFASLSKPGDTTSGLYSVNLKTGAATLLGTIGGNALIRDIALGTAVPVPSGNVTGNLTPASGSGHSS